MTRFGLALILVTLIGFGIAEESDRIQREIHLGNDPVVNHYAKRDFVDILMWPFYAIWSFLKQIVCLVVEGTETCQKRLDGAIP